MPLTWVVGAAACGSSTSVAVRPNASSNSSAPSDTSPSGTNPSGTNPSGTSTSTTTTAGSPGRVDIVDYDFTPNTITVKAGDTVTWTNLDTSDHWVVSSPTSPSTFDLGRQSTGATVNFTFGSPASYPYFCNLHNYMKGTVVVS